MSFGGLRLRLVLLILLATVPMAAMVIYGAERSRQAAYDEIGRDARRAAMTISAEHDRLLHGPHEQVLASLAQSLGGPDIVPENCNKFLAEALARTSTYANLGLVSAGGDLVCSAIRPGGRLNVGQAPWFVRAMQEHRYSVGEYQMDSLTARASLHLAYPMLDAMGQVRGLVYALLDLSWMEDHAMTAGLPGGGKMVVFDDRGLVLYRYPDPEGLTGKEMAGAPVVEAVLSRGGRGVAESMGYDNVQRIFGFAPLRGTTGRVFVAVGISVTAASAEANDVLAPAQAGMAAVLALAFIGAWLLGRAFVLRPVGRLLGLTHRLATGDLSARSGAGSGGGELGELGELGRAFDGMAEYLQQRDAEAQLAGEEIRRSEERFRGLIENSYDAISLLSAELEILYNTPAGRTILGYGKEVLGRNLFYFLHPEEKAEAANIQQRVIQEPDTAVNFLVRMRHEDGTWRWVAGTAKNMLAIPAVGAIVVNWRDVTVLKQTEDALVESQREYRSIFDNAAEGILRTTLEGRITAANPAASRLLGYSSPEELMESVADAAELYAYEGARERVLRRLEVGKEVKSGEMQVRRRDGSLVWVLAGASPVYTDSVLETESVSGRLVGIQGMLVDISERKRAEETLVRLSAAVEQSADHVIITDANGVILYVNEAFVSLTGYSREEALGHTPRILKSGKHDLAFYENLWGTILSGNVFRGILTDRKKDGSLYFEEKTISPIHDADCKITHFVSTSRDVTGRLQREREMESLVKVADALQKSPNRQLLMSALLDEVAVLLGAEHTVLVMVDTGGAEKVVEIARGAWSGIVGERSPLDQGIIGHIIQTGQPYVSDDPQNDPLFERKHLLEGINMAALVPLIVQGEVLGVLGVGRSGPITGAEVRLLTAVANMASSGIQRAALHEQTQDSLRRITSLRTVDMAISSSMDLRIIISVVLDQVVSHLGVDASCILQLNSRTGELEYAGGRGFRTEAVASARLWVGEGLAGRAIMERKTIHVPDLAGVDGVLLGQGVLKGEGFVSYLGAPLVAKGQVKGVLEAYQRSPLRPDHEWLEFLEALAGQMAIAVDNAALFDDLQRTNMELTIAYDATLEGWVKALDMRHKETEGHTRRVVGLATRLGRAFGLSETEQGQLRRGALLHDIGKIGVPDGTLMKPASLNEGEWDLMRRHPQYAYEFLAPIAFLRPSLDIPYCHHEKWDGTGYPRGLKGEEIPMFARIFAIVDVYDALRSDREYRPAWPEDKVREHLRSLSGSHFEPVVVDTFLRMLESEGNT